MEGNHSKCPEGWSNVGDFRNLDQGKCRINTTIIFLLWMLDLCLVCGLLPVVPILVMRANRAGRLTRRNQIFYSSVVVCFLSDITLATIRILPDYHAYMISTHWLPGLLNGIYYAAFCLAVVIFLIKYIEYIIVATNGDSFMASDINHRYLHRVYAALCFCILISTIPPFFQLGCEKSCALWTGIYMITGAITYGTTVLLVLPKVFSFISADMEMIEENLSDSSRINSFGGNSETEVDQKVDLIRTKRKAMWTLLNVAKALVVPFCFMAVIPFVEELYQFLPYVVPWLHISIALNIAIGFKTIWLVTRRTSYLRKKRKARSTIRSKSKRVAPG
uniref:Uncharacterized protein n=1 Tax=Mucochytrium quahogii TaxID=96639 RepID=A0A7S2REF2_9STRA|mmetsp:Transcript_13835/g.30051  ORF Transcript_13835/g.30051 Transcript_13835/m.30051 type:complete len:333 (+) Transcript_13835:1171-2169(+)